MKELEYGGFCLGMLCVTPTSFGSGQPRIRSESSTETDIAPATKRSRVAEPFPVAATHVRSGTPRRSTSPSGGSSSAAKMIAHSTIMRVSRR